MSVSSTTLLTLFIDNKKHEYRIPEKFELVHKSHFYTGLLAKLNSKREYAATLELQNGSLFKLTCDMTHCTVVILESTPTSLAPLFDVASSVAQLILKEGVFGFSSQNQISELSENDSNISRRGLTDENCFDIAFVPSSFMGYICTIPPATT
jgi:hypothetical protein